MSDNMLQPIFDTFWQAGTIIIRKLFKIKKKFDIEEFFKVCNLKNSKDEYPTLYKKIDLENDEIKYLMTIPTSLSLKDFNKYQEALSNKTNTKIKMTYKDGFIEILSTKEQKLQELYKYENIPANPIEKGITIPLGYSLNGLEYIKLKSNPHSYVVGSTGGGKSVCMKSMLTSLITNYNENELELHLGDLKYVELSLFKNCKIVKEFYTSVEDVTEMIRRLLIETEERYKLFEAVGVTSIQDYNKMFPHKKLKYQILVVEEIVNLLQDNNKKKAMKLLKRLISISRSSGLYVILTTQRPSADVIDTIVKANISNRIVFHVESEKDSVIALDELGAESLDVAGRGILKVGSKRVNFQGFYIEDKEVRKLIKPYLKIEINAPESNYNKEFDTKVNKGKLKAKIDDNKEDARNVKDLSFLDKL